LYSIAESVILVSMNDEPIIVYGAEWCAFCHQAMQYFDKLGVKYTYKNVDLDQAALQDAVSKSGQMGIPVIDMAGEIIVGFDKPRIDATLKAKQLAT
jgi:glutaredoxin 3